jgi:integrase
MHADKGGVPGLYLQVTGTVEGLVTGRSWIYRYQLNGRERQMGLGSLDDVSLAAARDKARDARALRAEGRDPIEARDQEAAAQRRAEARAVTFRECAEAYVKAHEAEWSNPVHRAQWRSTLGLPREDGRQPGKHRKPKCPSVIATIGNQPVSAVDTPLVMSCLQPLWDAGLYETCLRVRGRIEKVLDWAKVSGYRQGENPARWKGHISELLGDRNQLAPVRHHPAVPYEEMPALLVDLAGLNSVSARALAFTLLTVVRTDAIRGMRWVEFDLEARLWTVPPPRAKGRKAARREHRVPLSDQALAILEQMTKVKIGPYVFPGRHQGKPLSNMAMLECLRGVRSELWQAVGDANGPGYTVHGTARSAFKDWAAECTSFANIVSEAALQHTIKDQTERAYRRGDLLEKRRELMQAWADYACGKAATAADKPTPTRRRKGHQRRA